MRTPVDPDKLPLDPDFDALRGPAVAAARLTAAGLRQRFGADLPWQAEQSFDGRLFAPEKPLRAAAVLIGIVERAAGLHVVFTVRSSQLNDHAGQISFPGGRIETADADPVEAALREAREEIGLDHRLVEVLGTLPCYLTISGYQVSPVVGLIDAGARLRADPLEVEEFFEVPLAFLMDGANHQRRIVIQEPKPRFLYAMEFHGRRRYLIWGATAAMLRNFYRFLLA
jgi:8-oxo-dGTP pyrophosphatase MutT (NUDIX family)